MDIDNHLSNRIIQSLNEIRHDVQYPCSPNTKPNSNPIIPPPRPSSRSLHAYAHAWKPSLCHWHAILIPRCVSASPTMICLVQTHNTLTNVSLQYSQNRNVHVTQISVVSSKRMPHAVPSLPPFVSTFKNNGCCNNTCQVMTMYAPLARKCNGIHMNHWYSYESFNYNRQKSTVQCCTNGYANNYVCVIVHTWRSKELLLSRE